MIKIFNFFFDMKMIIIRYVNKLLFLNVCVYSIYWWDFFFENVRELNRIYNELFMRIK